MDRDGGRSPREIIESYVERFPDLKAGVSIGADFCYDIDVKIRYAPIEDNEFHCELYRSEEKAELTKSVLKQLAKNCEVYMKDENRDYSEQ
ncbi:hypothetical protein CHH58_16015 [Terribacillus saccharophilus]|uniref:hypothetical protein n=1 Tax=Terribacillus saccharophilus TaxID=361277 RepID=UPI000BA65C09|nr:hypothetical protein [Terribacillus saccharophilus]PAF35561.1 hypothetical protein CHH58_16015 [Terribacillus saccharophilus]